MLYNKTKDSYLYGTLMFHAHRKTNNQGICTRFGVVAYIINPSSWKAEARGLGFQG